MPISEMISVILIQSPFDVLLSDLFRVFNALDIITVGILIPVDRNMGMPVTLHQFDHITLLIPHLLDPQRLHRLYRRESHL